ncbi:MAG TPA: D-glycerate dehydrogenase [Vicinamibacterales bacterium]|jgi:glyoxylate reductase|nr:D-glycerate dehydrogenase [Vicinamibacterales bacterium]
MPRPKVLLTRRIPSSALATLEAACDVDRNDGHQLSPEELKTRLGDREGVVCLLTDAFTADVMDAAPRLKVIANVAVGYNNIDVAAATARGIVVTNTPEVLTEATADLAWALIMDITRRVSEGDRLIRRGGWKGWALDFMLGNELNGKTLGIIGYGRIGQAVAARAVPFGLRVIHSDVQAVPGSGAIPVDRLLATSDIVSIHCPLTPETRHMINQAALARMKRSAYLINTSRGPVVDEAALAWALKNGIISGAALDVYEEEPMVHPDLLTLENVVLAPHLGSATTETRTAMADLAVRNAIAVLTGQSALTPVS